MNKARFRTLCWLTLGFVVFVIVWGALVRATGSGAGCGSHWPTCNGEVVPRTGTTATVIELTHRVTSGLSALMVLAQLIFSRRLFPAGHRVRIAVGWSSALMILEVLIGAGIVLLGYVTDNKSLGRAAWMAVHLVNTFLLMGALTLSTYFANGGKGFRMRGHGLGSALAIGSVVGMLFVGMSGAIAALGDTLFPAATLAEALASDLSPTAHAFIRLRILHPFIAVGTALAILLMRSVVGSRHESDTELTRWGNILRVLVLLQMAFGMLNLVLMAPIWLQLIHLLAADALWMALIVFIARGFAASDEVGLDTRTTAAASTA